MTESEGDLLTNYKNIEKLDAQIGVIIDELKADVIFFLVLFLVISGLFMKQVFVFQW